jgi:bifunctional non-homologous end joining protein LigD
VDGEAVWCGKDGKSDFDRLHSNAHDEQVFLYGFDVLELNSEDYRQHSLEKRKAKLEKILARTQGIRFSEHLDGDGETIFEQACKMGLEGIVSKRRDFHYRSGRCKSWVKIKNPTSPAVIRIQDGSWWPKKPTISFRQFACDRHEKNAIFCGEFLDPYHGRSTSAA